ncbi:MAG: hypothetical protein A2186_03095 [Candidatus Levybacteria bacterium RIFOXYA1_FULL_41_10]|nr:MAG: hypothetical protein UT44_C0024G0006 [Candidatus Levybacteria bacterium GW2011_GWA1_39_32]KKR50292.1 MAG: hypothetical protein UT87_C0018G0010 [Candidatus Levybacteria bacterium GW2011_GWC1_40_19]KKR71458.1 MAG: hypothetical protein UU15_C0051G0003 [Candidatus Levybacteria bacterium GW2011_GWC2_40_7]KKR94773.1 MAG: hypothetical protein UU45_C0007G0021 [Candidatus Levybacteria bacterium GW2011_GWA2_41_15]OGH21168.1 MAG: hypothetical protein A2695_00910 [Candidatus Levybacteria bacterium 
MDNLKPKLVFLDVDGTLFDSKSYRSAFKQLIVQKLGVDPASFEEIEDQTYNSFSIFEPGSYLSLLLSRLDKAQYAEELKGLIFSEAFLETFLFDDAVPFVEDVSRIAKVGILSRGDQSTQEAKIRRITGLLDSERIYILPDKIGSAKQIIELNRDFRVWFVDNSPEVLHSYKNADSSWKTILIERGEAKSYNNSSDFKARDLKEVLGIISK